MTLLEHSGFAIDKVVSGGGEIVKEFSVRYTTKAAEGTVGILSQFGSLRT